MKRIVLVLLLAILLPAVLLASLALRSLRDQELVVESQRIRLLQSGCDALGERINTFLEDLRRFHAGFVEEVVAEQGDQAEERFDELVRARWSQAAAAAVVRDGAVIVSPDPEPGTPAEAFLQANGDFLTSRRVVELYQAPPLAAPLAAEEAEAPVAGGASIAAAPPAMPFPASAADTAAAAPAPAVSELKSSPSRLSAEGSFPGAARARNKTQEAREAEVQETLTAPPMPSKWKVAPLSSKPAAPAPGSVAISRNVMPAQQRFEMERPPDETESAPVAAANASAYVPEPFSNRNLTVGAEEGAVSRLIDGKPHILLWKRHPGDSRLTFWTGLDLETLGRDLAAIFSSPPEAALSREACFVLLDSGGEPVARTREGFAADWSAPLVASEVGPLLPRWEVAAYLLDPGSLNASARKVRLTLWCVILALLAAVAVGSVLVARSVGEEIKLATRKTDFVGNVSHELKTPLTSIRMFSELLSGPGQPDPSKTRHYAEIISRESARLARLINRLLDFSRLDRGEMRLQREPLDFGNLVGETVEGMREPCEAAGMTVETEIPAAGGPRVEGDRDALAQVVVNLLGNAIKYASKGGSVRVEVGAAGGKATLAVSDRGPGVPRAHRRKIFERFYRVDDSIHSGIDGSGIGLALCRQVAEQHGGTIRCDPRKGGGCVFFLEIPLLT